jgi:hypothetical protein
MLIGSLCSSLLTRVSRFRYKFRSSVARWNRPESDLASNAVRRSAIWSTSGGRRSKRRDSLKEEAQRASITTQRGRELRLLLAHRDLASRIHVRNAAESGQTRTDANDPEPTPWQFAKRNAMQCAAADHSVLMPANLTALPTCRGAYRTCRWRRQASCTRQVGPMAMMRPRLEFLLCPS